MKEAPGILLAGGGTGGHLFPALAIADEIKRLRPNARFLFLGTKDKIEARVVPERGYPFRAIWISGFHRGLKPANLIFPVKVAVSLIQSFSVIRSFKPDAVIGTGGYVCGPILFAASMMGIPTVVHESNSYPGITTRLLAARMTRVFTAFEVTNRWMKRRDNIELTGTPVRASLGTVSRADGARRFGLDPGKPTLLVFGGSLGAASINAALLDAIVPLVDAGLQIVWQTGRPEYERIVAATPRSTAVWIGSFIDRMEDAYAASDLVVCRAGATTIAELTALGKPAILVPYPYAAADHQTMNARTLADAGAAVMIRDVDAAAQLIEAAKSLLQDEQRRADMSAACRRMGRPDAGRRIAETILAMIDR